MATTRDLPRFRQEEIEPGLLKGDLADAFQAFLAELLASQLPGVTTWSAAGKDGGIDLRAPGPPCAVVEAKVVGDDDAAAIIGRWTRTRDNLRRNLSPPLGPPTGQAQYAPWYDVGHPIRAYWFCTTACFANAAQEDALAKDISGFFHDELGALPHLAHLRKLEVRVLAWPQLASLVLPHLRFRWFRRTRPTGLSSLEEPDETLRFHAYLHRARLPYYSRAEHLRVEPAPADLQILDEQALLDRLGRQDDHGMIVVGAGGFGKTRLTLEVAWRAQEAGWTVLRVGRRLAPGAIEALAAQLAPDDPVLIWLDYVETQVDFAELVETIGDLNDSLGLHLRFLASCRSSYPSAPV